MFNLLLTAGAAWLGYSALKGKQSTSGKHSLLTTAKSYQPQQPSLRYPFQPPAPPRVDNQNQPWSPPVPGGRGPADTFQAIGTISKGTATAVHSVKDIWGDFSDMFGGNDDKANLTSTDSLPSQPPIQLAGGDDYPPNSVGDMSGDTQTLYDDESYYA